MPLRRAEEEVRHSPLSNYVLCFFMSFRASSPVKIRYLAKSKMAYVDVFIVVLVCVGLVVFLWGRVIYLFLAILSFP